MNKNLSAKKSFGQNFLKSKKIIDQIIKTSNLSEKDIVIEIGPGKGALTKKLLETGATVFAFELDERMFYFLEEELFSFIKKGKLKLFLKDILDIKIEDYVPYNEDYKVIANIPYYITNAILRKFLETEHQATDMIFLVQKEVADRILVRDNKESLLSLSVSLYGKTKYITKVDRKYFSPTPKVDSAVIHIFDISHEKLANRERELLFFSLIKTAFSHKRKKCIKNLEKKVKKEVLEKIFLNLGIDNNIRAEEINISLWIKIFNNLEKYMF